MAASSVWVLGADRGMRHVMPTLSAIEGQIGQRFSRIEFILVVKQPTLAACNSCGIASEQHLRLHWSLQACPALVSGEEQEVSIQATDEDALQPYLLIFHSI